MTDVKVSRGTISSRVFAVVALAGIVVMAFMPSWGEPATQRKMVELFTLLALAQMWNLLAGFGGVVSVGQQAFMGLGAYAMVSLVNVHGKDMYLSVPISALIVAALAVPMGLVAFRLRGSYFAIGTWVLAEVASKVIITVKSLGAGDGVSLKVSGYSVSSRQDLTYWLAMVTGVGSVLLAYVILRSRLGLQMQAIRDDEGGARGLGVNVYRTRFQIWVIAAFWTALAAAPYYLQQLRVQPVGTGGAFSVVQWTAPIIFIVVIGGIGTIEGPIIGAILYYVLRNKFQDHQTVYLISMGAVALAVALWLQGGIWGTIRRWVGVDLFPVRRRVTTSDQAVAQTSSSAPA
ncbi:MAG TPA: branched-chain amino acid ABC transporter permease [Ilumatobacteraceae bacterium]|nr:branched-chain amino acid ABC transporter permease [Ilumatobacteraceae bacterium]